MTNHKDITVQHDQQLLHNGVRSPTDKRAVITQRTPIERNLCLLTGTPQIHIDIYGHKSQCHIYDRQGQTEN